MSCGSRCPARWTNTRSLNFIIGHMGEGLPVMLARCEHQFRTELSHLSRPLAKTITDQVYVTSAGFFTNPPFVAALETFGIDRLMFSVDYPYASNADGRAFLDKVPLSPGDLEKFAHGNADRLLKLSQAPARKEMPIGKREHADADHANGNPGQDRKQRHKSGERRDYRLPKSANTTTRRRCRATVISRRNKPRASARCCACWLARPSPRSHHHAATLPPATPATDAQQ